MWKFCSISPKRLYPAIVKDLRRHFNSFNSPRTWDRMIYCPFNNGSENGFHSEGAEGTKKNTTTIVNLGTTKFPSFNPYHMLMFRSEIIVHKLCSFSRNRNNPFFSKALVIPQSNGALEYSSTVNLKFHKDMMFNHWFLNFTWCEAEKSKIRFDWPSDFGLWGLNEAR